MGGECLKLAEDSAFGFRLSEGDRATVSVSWDDSHGTLRNDLVIGETFYVVSEAYYNYLLDLESLASCPPFPPPLPPALAVCSFDEILDIAESAGVS